MEAGILGRRRQTMLVLAAAGSSEFAIRLFGRRAKMVAESRPWRGRKRATRGRKVDERTQALRAEATPQQVVKIQVNVETDVVFGLDKMVGENATENINKLVSCSWSDASPGDARG